MAVPGRRRLVLVAAIAAASGMAVATTLAWAPAPAAAAPGLVIWAPPAQAKVLEGQLQGDFAGRPATVVAKAPEAILAQLGTVDASAAPDVIWVDSSHTADLVTRSLVRRVPLGTSIRARFPGNLLGAFRYGFADYGLPVTFSNVALVVNRDQVSRTLTTFRDVERAAARALSRGRATVGIAVGQGVGAEQLVGPLFTGLGGYLFGRNAAGSLDPYNVGLANEAFLANVARIDKWNDTGLLVRMTAAQAQEAFVDGLAPFWITGPESEPVLDDLDFRAEVLPVPVIVEGLSAAPFLVVEGAMVTTAADQHGVTDLAVRLLRRHLAQPAVQRALATAGSVAPAHVEAGMGRRAAAFAAAGIGGTPLPNIPQAHALWGPFAQAWARATNGADALQAGAAFRLAQAAVIRAIT